VGSIGPGLVAFCFAAVLAIVGLVPWVTVQYQRNGTLRTGSTILAFSVLVYALALAAYTLLPLPTDIATMCLKGGKAAQTQLFGFLNNIERHGGYHGPASLFSNWGIAQVLFNVLLFVPFGMFARHAVRRRGVLAGVAVASVTGFLVSLFVECTQVTGAWYLYPCAYRQFDVDDLLVNTTGAVIGACLAPLLTVLSGKPSGESAADAARPVTVGRRLLGMLCDVLVVALAGGVLRLAVGLMLFVAGAGGVAGEPAVGYVLGLLPALAQLACVRWFGRTAGEAVVRLRADRIPTWRQALVRWILGIGGWSLLSGVDSMWGLIAYALALAAVVGVWTTRGRRGVGYAAAGLDLRDSRVPAGGGFAGVR
jgi:glycopeptide antibiotics resistance protein